MTLEKLNKIPNFTIMLVEDMPAIRAQLIADLRELKYSGIILEAENLQIASETIQKEKLNLVICDWNLPDGKGIDFLKAVKKHHRFEKLPFIMCTTVDEVANILDAIKSGAKEYVVKPWSISELAKKINSVIS